MGLFLNRSIWETSRRVSKCTPFSTTFHVFSSLPSDENHQYLLVRPYPSLRIIFVSPGLRIPGLLQSRFLSRIGGPSHVRDGLSDAFEAGAAVTAKILWLPQGRSASDNDSATLNSTHSDRDHVNDPSRPKERRVPSKNHGMSVMHGMN